MARIVLEVSFVPEYIMGLCNWLRGVNAAIMLERRELPLLYDSGVVYEREVEESFKDVVHLYQAGEDDCDTLAPARAGELVAHGWKALRPGDQGYEAALALRPDSIPAFCFFTTRDLPEDPGPKLYHVEVGYHIGGVRFEDDPSARLGMYDGRIDPHVLQRWKAAGISTPGAPLSVGFVPVEVQSWR